MRARGVAALAALVALTAACSGSGEGPGRDASSTADPTPAAVRPERLDPGPTCVPPEPANGRRCLSLAPAERRVDLTAPVFSNPTAITNPLHPTGRTEQVIHGGQVDGGVFRTEFTRLPERKTIVWAGRTVEVVTMQYLAFHDGRIAEVALDWFAQADDGSVWYFGEDVFNYEDGALADTDGSWLAGREGPAAMIMPARPSTGDVYRPENAPGLVFEEVEVRATGRTVQGPGGPIAGAIVVREVHQDGVVEDKVFAPGYGEFSTGSGGDLEAASLAMPTDARAEPAPPSLAPLSAAVDALTAAAMSDPPAPDRVTAVQRAWAVHRTTGVPSLLERQMSRDVAALAAAVGGGSAAQVRDAVLRVAQNELDLRLPYGDVASTDRARIALWARQAGADAAAGDDAGVRGDVAALGWTWQRARHTVSGDVRAAVEARLAVLRAAADGEPGAVGRASRDLLAVLDYPGQATT